MTLQHVIPRPHKVLVYDIGSGRVLNARLGPVQLPSSAFSFRFGHGSPPKPSARKIVSLVAAKHGLTFQELKSRSRIKRIARARQEAMWELKRNTDLSLKQIAWAVGLDDHSTVHHGIGAHERRRAERLAAE